jgi:Protein of unknown function (DUF1236)
MRNLRLLFMSVTVLLLGTAAVSAQDMKTNDRSSAPTAQQNAPGEKMAPASKSDSRNATEKSGRVAPESDRKELKSHNMDKGAAPAAPTKDPANSADSTDAKSKSTNKADESGVGASPATKSAEETNHSATAGSAKLSTEQRTKIAAVVLQHKVEPAQLNIPVRVGTRVPDSVRFYPLPQEVFVIYPEWRGYDYILVGDEIVVMDPRTHEIVAILEA